MSAVDITGTPGALMAVPVVRWCVTCDAPKHKWDHNDPLYRTGAHQCPSCIRSDIDDDQRQKRREDQ